MKILTDKDFLKNYNKRISPHKNLTTKFNLRLKLFTNDPNHPLLKTHRLVGKKQGLFSFSITGDIRVVFKYINNKDILLIDIGSHNQVY